MEGDDDGGVSWNKIVTLVFVISAMIILMILVTMIFIMPILRE